MDPSRFDTVARSLAHRPSRRRLFQALGALGLGSLLLRPAARTAARAGDCPLVKCSPDDCLECFIDNKGQCWCTCKVCSSSGIAGGGLVRTGIGGEAHLALLATRTAVPDQPGTFAVQGQVRWADPAWEGTGLTLESAALTFYGPLEGVEGGREAVGWLRADRAPGEYPFVLRAVDASPPGAGQDTVALWVGDAIRDDPVAAGAFTATPEPSGFRYAAEGTLVSGDLQLLTH